MIYANEKLLKDVGFDVLFYDTDNAFPKSMMARISKLLGEMHPVKEEQNRYKTNWSFYLVNNPDKDFSALLKRRLQFSDENSFTVIVVNSEITKDHLKYLLLPVNGIISLNHFESNPSAVLNNVLNCGICLDPESHKLLSHSLAYKKTQHTPVKHFKLNHTKVSHELTERERQVLQLLLEGCSNSAIAENLHFARSTISTIISSLLRKMKARDRTDAAVKAIRYGWVDSVR